MIARRASTAQALPAAGARSDLLRLCAVLFKLRIGVAVSLSGLGGALVAAGHGMSLPDAGLLVLSVLLAASGAGAFNHWYERDIDALMGRTRSRPFVSGRLEAGAHWPTLFASMILAGAAIAFLRFNPVCSLFVLAGGLTYAVVYTVWLKRRTHWNIVIGGAAGSFAVLAGAAAAGDFQNPQALLLAAVLFLWTPSHFWSLAVPYADDYRCAGVPMLPVTHGLDAACRWNLVNTLLLGGLVLWFAATSGRLLIWLGALAGSGWLLWTTFRMTRTRNRDSAMAAFRASLLQLGLLLAGLFAAHAVP